MQNDKNWYVLRTEVKKEDILMKVLEKNKISGAFSPKFEYYRRDDGQIHIKPLFPGYVLIKTEMNASLFAKKIKDIQFYSVYFQELKYEGNLSSLTAEEITMLDRLLDKDHILRMSYGTIMNGRLMITHGPLKGYDPYVIKVDRHNRLVTLNLYFLNQRWVVGMTVLDKMQNDK